MWCSILILFFITRYCLADWVEIPQVITKAQIAEPPKAKSENLDEPISTTDYPSILRSSNEETTKLTRDSPKVQGRITVAEDLPDATTEPYSEEDYYDEEDDDFEDTYTNSSSNYNYTNEDENHESDSSGFLPFMKRIQSSLLSKTHNSEGSKILVLSNLRDNMLYEIHRRIKSLWYPKKAGAAEARGHDEGEGHMDFPSHEGALMTISFLTFAVYIVKYVLKLIHALKAKTQSTTTTTTMAPEALAAYLGRRKREIPPAYDDEANKILQLIEEYSFT